MNANELADILEELHEQDKSDGVGHLAMPEAATMLRQQEKELIEAGHMIGVLREYISDLENGLDSSINLNKAQAERQVKELTDVEISLIAEEFTGADGLDVVDFGRAILRKAREK